MYTSMQDYDDNSYTKGTDHSPRPIPASGFPTAPPQPPPPPSVPYMAATGGSRGYRSNHGAVVAEQWSTNLCHCCDDPANCVVTCFCPCITFGQIAEIVDRGAPGNSCKCGCAGKGAVYGLLVFTGFACLYSCFYRSTLRGQYDLVEAPCVDCLVHFCCESCALCQEYRELNRRGFDMGIGWEANMDRQQRAVAMVPPVTGHGMTR